MIYDHHHHHYHHYHHHHCHHHRPLSPPLMPQVARRDTHYLDSLLIILPARRLPRYNSIPHPPSPPSPIQPSNPNPTQPNRAVPQCTCTSDPRVHCREPARVVRVVRASGVAESVERPRPAWLFGSTDVKSRAWRKATTLLPPQQLASRAPSPRNPRNHGYPQRLAFPIPPGVPVSRSPS